MAEPYRKKLIEVALPLEAINDASRREKSPFTKNHPRALHVWWARRPLAACRAVLFASIVDDPSSHPDVFPTEEEQDAERHRLFGMIEKLVKWENTTNEIVLEAAREEIRKATNGNPPPVLDPFCGGGSIPLEAQRLGLEAYASDLNPVAVLITKALIEIPPKFAGKPPVNPGSKETLAHGATWNGAHGLAEDVRYYGRWMRDEAFKRIGYLYPKVKLPGGGEVTVIAWIWTRTVTCPNPACGTQMPLVRSFALSTKKGKEWHVEPTVDPATKSVRFEIKSGSSEREGTKRRGTSECLVCGTHMNDATLRAQAAGEGIREQLMSVVAEGDRKRVYLAPSNGIPSVEEVEVAWLEQPLPDNARWFSPPGYGLTTYYDLFTARQRLALITLCDLVPEARDRVLALCDDEAYADAVATYLGLAISRLTDFSNSICSWDSGNTNLRQLFSRQAIPMAWDFAEGNLLDGVVTVVDATNWAASAIESVPQTTRDAYAKQLDASASVDGVERPIVCTDPPYYDNIGYSDLSDFFYVWLRRSLGRTYPRLFSTVLTPKSRELVATPYHFDGDADRAKAFFEDGLRQSFARMCETHHAGYPLTLFYAFKQAESSDGSVASTGWDTMLTGLLESGLMVTGTWPMRTEQQQRSVGIGTNALASSIVLVCRPRPTDAPIATRRELVSSLRVELPEALRQLQHGNIAPVDLAQSAIGPGMAVFSRYAKVVEADGQSMAIRAALELINQVLDELLAEQEGDFDADTRFAVTWFEQRGTDEGPYGEADVLARAKDTSVEGMERAGILVSRAGKVRLVRRDELDSSWDPASDPRLTVWETAQHLVKLLTENGESAAADLLRRLGSGYGENAHELAFRLYTICERKGWAQEGLGYNALGASWSEIARLASLGTEPTQATLEV